MWQRVPHEAADREMFCRVGSGTTVFGSRGLALQCCNGWVLWPKPAALKFRHFSWNFQCIVVRAESWMSNLVDNLQVWSRDRRNASVRFFALTTNIFVWNSGLCVLLTTDVLSLTCASLYVHADCHGVGTCFHNCSDT